MFIKFLDCIPDELIIICRDKITQDKVKEILIDHNKVTNDDFFCFETDEFFSRLDGINAIRIGPDGQIGHGTFHGCTSVNGALNDLIGCYNDWFENPTMYIEGTDFISSFYTLCQHIDQSALFDFL